MAATMTQKRDYYEVLGIARDASSSQIIAAYRKMAFRFHPDLHPGDAESVEKFKEVTEAFEILSNADSRRQYDNLGQRRGEPVNYEEQIARKAAAQSPTRVHRGATFTDLFGRKKNP